MQSDKQRETHMPKDQNRCWPGYEPVPGKSPHSQGSCKPKAESKSTPSDKEFRAKRRKQLDRHEAQHPGERSQSRQHLGAPSPAKKTAAKKSQSDKKNSSPAKRKAAAKTSKKVQSSGTGARKSTLKKAAAPKSRSKTVTRKKSSATRKAA